VSTKALIAVAERYDGPKDRYLVLHAMAKLANGATQTYRMPLEEIAFVGRVTLRTARREVRALLDEGVVSLIHKGGWRGNASVYRIELGRLDALPERGSCKPPFGHEKEGREKPPFENRKGVVQGSKGGPGRPKKGVVEGTPLCNSVKTLYPREVAPLAQEAQGAPRAEGQIRTPNSGSAEVTAEKVPLGKDQADEMDLAAKSKEKIRELSDRLKRRDFPANGICAKSERSWPVLTKRTEEATDAPQP
jgi:hypothetical protein